MSASVCLCHLIIGFFAVFSRLEAFYTRLNWSCQRDYSSTHLILLYSYELKFLLFFFFTLINSYIKFTFTSFKNNSLLMCVCACVCLYACEHLCTCHGILAEVRREHCGVGSSFHFCLGSGNQTEVARLSWQVPLSAEPPFHLSLFAYVNIYFLRM